MASGLILERSIFFMRKFKGICLITQDMRRLCEFYQTVLEVVAQGDEFFASLPVPGAELSIFAAPGMQTMAPGSMEGAGTGSYSLEFEVGNVDQEYERLKTLNVPVIKPPTTQPWGLRSVWFRDPDGNIINFYAPVALVP
jgi:catechol 2,3-dioxygenase-like lactoylglutathione lyase family enzyme